MRSEAPSGQNRGFLLNDIVCCAFPAQLQSSPNQYGTTYKGKIGPLSQIFLQTLAGYRLTLEIRGFGIGYTQRGSYSAKGGVSAFSASR